MKETNKHRISKYIMKHIAKKKKNRMERVNKVIKVKTNTEIVKGSFTFSEDTANP